MAVKYKEAGPSPAWKKTKSPDSNRGRGENNAASFSRQEPQQPKSSSFREWLRKFRVKSKENPPGAFEQLATGGRRKSKEFKGAIVRAKELSKAIGKNGIKGMQEMIFKRQNVVKFRENCAALAARERGNSGKPLDKEQQEKVKEKALQQTHAQVEQAKIKQVRDEQKLLKAAQRDPLYKQLVHDGFDDVYRQKGREASPQEAKAITDSALQESLRVVTEARKTAQDDPRYGGMYDKAFDAQVPLGNVPTPADLDVIEEAAITATIEAQQQEKQKTKAKQEELKKTPEFHAEMKRLIKANGGRATEEDLAQFQRDALTHAQSIKEPEAASSVSPKKMEAKAPLTRYESGRLTILKNKGEIAMTPSEREEYAALQARENITAESTTKNEPSAEDLSRVLARGNELKARKAAGESLTDDESTFLGTLLAGIGAGVSEVLNPAA